MKHDEIFKLAALTASILHSRSGKSIQPSYSTMVKKTYATLLELHQELKEERTTVSEEDFSDMMNDPL